MKEFADTLAELEKISGYTAEQAKDQLMKSLEEELVHEKAIKIIQMLKGE